MRRVMTEKVVVSDSPVEKVVIRDPDEARKREHRLARMSRISQQTIARRAVQKAETRKQYGPDYQALRRQYKAMIEQIGGWCMEEECVHPTRRIEIGAEWQLAHDHSRGGPLDLRGPAHPECNLDEMHRRQRLEKKREQIAEKLKAIELVHAAALKAA